MKDPRNAQELTWALAQALGVPPLAYKAVLTLEANQEPKLELSMYVTDDPGNLVTENLQGTAAERVKEVQFMLRLAPFPKEAG